jgi:RNA polymerase sigma factor (sigma-70 family)
MNNQEILDMCRRLAKKYYNHQDYDDLVSEGVVECLKLRSKGVKEPYKLWYRARDVMYDYINVKSSNFSYPSGMRGRDAVKEDTTDFIDSEDAQIPADDLFGSYELKDSIEVLKKHLTSREWKVFLSLYNNNNNLSETARDLNISFRGIINIRDRVRNKLVTFCDFTI